MRISRSPVLQRRDDDDDDQDGVSYYIWVAVGVVAVSIILLVTCVTCARRRRNRSVDPPLLLPKFLHKYWRKWSPPKYRTINTPLEERQRQESTTSSTRTPSFREPDDLDRRTSVRSILTLPAYNPTVRPNEQLIAREGERAGVDTVIEYPENEEQAETRREEEMQALFNIRQARRREAADREERRRQRRAARERGDWARLEELQRQSRARAQQRSNVDQADLVRLQEAEARGDLGMLSGPDSSYLVAELNSIRERHTRERRVSSVSYADLGTARHDGTRLRAASFESDHMPLLESAASVGQRSRATSRASSTGRRPSIMDSRPTTGHARNESYGSYLSDDEGEGARSPGTALLTPQMSEELPPHPPSYDDDLSVHGGEAPPYESPIMERAPGSFGRSYDADETPRASVVVRTQTDELRDEVHVAERYLESRVDSTSSSPTADTPTDSTGDRQGQSQQVSPKAQHAPSSGIEPGPVQRSPPLPRLQTRPRIPPAIEVSSATPVSSVPNSPRSIR